MLEMLASDLLSGSFQLKKQGRSLPTQMLRETSVGEARRHVCAVGVRAARLASASAPYATRSLCRCLLWCPLRCEIPLFIYYIWYSPNSVIRLINRDRSENPTPFDTTKLPGQYTWRMDKTLPGKHTLHLYRSLTSDQTAILIQARTGHYRLNQYLSRCHGQDVTASDST
jgi:hypothetical protein